MSSEAGTRLLEAAKAVNRKFCNDAISELVDLDAAISDAERQAADDALPIDDEFLREMFPILESWCEDTILVGSGMMLVESAAGTWSLWHEAEEIVEFMTRKKVRNLVELMKGGGA